MTCVFLQPSTVSICDQYPDERKFFDENGKEKDSAFLVKMWNSTLAAFTEMWVCLDDRDSVWKEIIELAEESGEP